MDFINRYLEEAKNLIDLINRDKIEQIIGLLDQLRQNPGRLFILGIGGSAGNASHAVNDFRKIVGIETYTPTDNVSELTARINDDGWANVFTPWLQTSRLCAKDMVMVFSVGGGNLEKNISANLVTALQYAKTVGATITGIVGRDGGYTATVADACLILPSLSQHTITPHTEAFQSVIWHLFVSHPLLQKHPTKWESVVENAI